jgi:hypothetical protein
MQMRSGTRSGLLRSYIRWRPIIPLWQRALHWMLHSELNCSLVLSNGALLIASDQLDRFGIDR